MNQCEEHADGSRSLCNHFYSPQVGFGRGFEELPACQELHDHPPVIRSRSLNVEADV